jgi:molecular chaperone GrpE
MVELPSEDAEPGTIVEEMQPGYMMKDRLLRPALVGVAKKPD